MTRCAASLSAGWLDGRRWTVRPHTLVPLRAEDAAALRVWRNAQTDVLRQQRPLGEDDQRRWYHDVLLPAHAVENPTLLLVSMLLNGRFVAYGGLTNVDWDSRRAEVSFLADPDRAADPETYAADFTTFLRWLAGLAFNELGLHRLFAETYAFRTAHIALLESCGFRREGLLRDHVVKRGRHVDSVLHGLLEGAG